MKKSLFLFCLLYLYAPQKTFRDAHFFESKNTHNTYITHNYSTTNNYSTAETFTKQIKSSDFFPSLTIDQPGHYTFTENIPCSSNTECALIIKTNDVVVDLNQFTLSSHGGPPFGICIQAGTKNIQIKNGNIRDFSRYAIRIMGTETTPCKNLTFKKLFLNDNGTGIYGCFCRNIIISSCIFNNQLQHGIHLYDGTYNLITNNNARGNALAGFYLESCNHCVIKENETSNNYYGFNETAVASTNLYMQNISFADKTAFNINYADSRLQVITTYPSGLEKLIDSNKYTNIKIIS